MRKILGFLASKIGLSCSSRNSRKFIDGWFLGAGITVKRWKYESCGFGKYEWKIGIVIQTRKDFKFAIYQTQYDCRLGQVFSFGYGAIVISHY